MANRDIIVIGASFGGSEAIPYICKNLPADLNAAVLIVWHLGEGSMGVLPNIILKESKLPAANARDGEALRTGKIYIAPPNRHLIIEEGIIKTPAGPKENRFRPAIDPLFRSAALYGGKRVIGVILTGLLNDGTSGLWTIKDKGGMAIVQNPDDAVCSGMPLSAIKNVEVDYVVDISEIPQLLVKLSNEEVNSAAASGSEKVLITELELVKDELKDDRDMNIIGEISQFTCPECHGSLWKMREGNILRFRCRTGHAYTAEALLLDLEDTVEDYLWNALRGVEESSSLMRNIGDDLKKRNNLNSAEEYFAKAKEAEDKVKILRQALMTKGFAKRTGTE